MIDQLIKAYNKAVENNDEFAMTIIYTRIRNLGYDFAQPTKQ